MSKEEFILLVHYVKIRKETNYVNLSAQVLFLKYMLEKEIYSNEDELRKSIEKEANKTISKKLFKSWLSGDKHPRGIITVDAAIEDVYMNHVDVDNIDLNQTLLDSFGVEIKNKVA